MCHNEELMSQIEDIERELRKVRVYKDYHVAKGQMKEFEKYKQKEVELGDNLYYTKLKLGRN